MRRQIIIPKLKKREISRLKRLLSRIEQGASPLLLAEWICQKREQLGTETFECWFAYRGHKQLGERHFERFMRSAMACLSESQQQEYRESPNVFMAREFAHAGFALGKDFSLAPGGVLVNEKVLDHYLPDIIF